jgi:K+-sensing histidine kinase KdpD
MQRIIDDLLTLSMLESAPEPPQGERVDVSLLLERIRVEAEALSAGRHRIVLDAEPGFDLLGAESEIASAFGNLASNAVRYTPAGGQVRLVWRASPRGAEFAGEDTGAGIEAEHIPRLTERSPRRSRPIAQAAVPTWASPSSNTRWHATRRCWNQHAGERQPLHRKIPGGWSRPRAASGVVT